VRCTIQETSVGNSDGAAIRSAVAWSLRMPATLRSGGPRSIGTAARRRESTSPEFDGLNRLPPLRRGGFPECFVVPEMLPVALYKSTD
jgi:hypothetical protein